MRKELLFIVLLIVNSVDIFAKGLLIDNVNGYTLDSQHQLHQFKSLYIRDGKVVEIGNSSLVKKYSNVNKINLQGKIILPGIIDAHGHIMGLGYSLLSLDVRESKDAQSIAQQAKIFADKHPNLQWIRGRGWNQVLWPKQQFPTASILDKYINDRPVWLRRIDGHAGWANSKALILAGINKDTVSPQGGEIIRDSLGNPTGVLIDNAMALLESKIPPHSSREMEKALNAASDHLLSKGVTSVHDAGIDYSTYNLYNKRAANGELDIRIYAMLSGSDMQLHKMLKNGYIRDALGFLSIRSVKLYADGALGSRGAALLKPYSDQPQHRGLLLTEKHDLEKLYKKILQYKFQINIHAIGDRGVRQVLDQFEQSPKQLSKDLRHRIEHAQVVSLEDIPRFKSLNIIPSMQPTHATSDMNMAEKRIGAERLKGAYAWRYFLDLGLPIAAGSDFPVELVNPFFGIHAAVTRQNRENKPRGGWVPSQAMTLNEVLSAFTVDAAYAAHQEDRMGSLMPGRFADFIVIDRNIFSIPKEDLWKTVVEQTWISGKKVFEKK